MPVPVVAPLATHRPGLAFWWSPDRAAGSTQWLRSLHFCPEGDAPMIGRLAV